MTQSKLQINAYKLSILKKINKIKDVWFIQTNKFDFILLSIRYKVKLGYHNYFC